MRIRYLDGLRGVAIGMAVLFHAFKNAQPEAFVSRYGLMGVELFLQIGATRGEPMVHSALKYKGPRLAPVI